ncbi:CRN4 protein [Phytophthora nicotianae]|uniref:Kinesin-like protein n=1 Tax=Phytophthora nicotianae TaxID=4792 RepID=A0A0W8D0P7_PHYNI|nr:CRN4 protein [Phytophthora nicotianae]
MTSKNSLPETSSPTISELKAEATPAPVVRRGGTSENIQVFIRIRPLIERETSQERCAGSHFICATDHQEQVYERVHECTQSFLEGFNSTLFAYGQTGSGKSFTMFGAEADLSRYRPGLQNSQAGIIPRAIKEIFAATVKMEADAQATVYCSFVQVYNEQIFDLLRDTQMNTPLEIHEDRKNGIFVEGLSEYAVRSVSDCLQLLQCGEQNRAVRSTHMNQVSSRSHSVFQLLLEQRRKDGTALKSKFNLVDLAGSEKWNMGAEMREHHISEMTNINLSLHTLGRCIASLSSKSTGGSTHVPYRDSKLTRLLQDSLGGNTKTKIIATLSPSLDCVEESISTLKFADRAKKVMVMVRVNEQREIDPAYVEKLQEELEQLREVVRLLQLPNNTSDCKDEGEGDTDNNNDNHEENTVKLRSFGSFTPSGFTAKPSAPMDMNYRVRGRSSSTDTNGNGECWKNDMQAAPALTVEKELELSRKAIEKQTKLQNWLIEKERREILKLQQEQQFIDEQRRYAAEKDAKFFKRAAATKKKLLLASAATSASFDSQSNKPATAET